MTTQRWTFVDTVADETWTVPINPKSATSPFPAKNIATAQGSDLDSHGIHRTRMFQTPSAPTPWEFGGLIRSKAHHDAYLAELIAHDDWLPPQFAEPSVDASSWTMISTETSHCWASTDSMQSASIRSPL